MFTHTSKVQLNSYHQNSSLLFQFLLSEFLQTSLGIHKLLLHAKNSTPSLHSLDEIISSLCGSPYGQSRFFSWSFEGGCFSKLKNYSTLLSQQNKGDKEFKAIEHYAARLYSQALPLTEVMNWAEDDSCRVIFHQTLKKTHSVLRQLTRSIMKTVPQFQDDENVLYFILRHADHLDYLFKPNFTLKLLSQLFVNGIQEASQLLLQKYAKRGFHQLLPSIRRQISMLQLVR